MKHLLFAVALMPLFAVAQSPDAANYAPRQILLVSPEVKDSEPILPMVMTIDGIQTLKFVPVSAVKEYLDHGAQPIRLGDVLSALKQDADTIAQLQAENERLWKVAMKDNPQAPVPTVILQQPPQDSRLNGTCCSARFCLRQPRT